jgi:hypothetical protein
VSTSFTLQADMDHLSGSYCRGSAFLSPQRERLTAFAGTILSSAGISMVVYLCYFFSVSYFAPSLYVGANAGLLFGIVPIIFLVLGAVYLWHYRQMPFAVGGIFVGFLACLVAIQVVLSGG